MIDWDALVLAPLMSGEIFGEKCDPDPDKDQRPRYVPYATGKPITIDGVFDQAWHDPRLLDDGAGINTVRPMLGVRVAQLPYFPPQQNDKVYIPRVKSFYVVNDAEPDGHGHALLRLTLQRRFP